MIRICFQVEQTRFEWFSNTSPIIHQFLSLFVMEADELQI